MAGELASPRQTIVISELWRKLVHQTRSAVSWKVRSSPTLPKVRGLPQTLGGRYK